MLLLPTARSAGGEVVLTTTHPGPHWLQIEGRPSVTGCVAWIVSGLATQRVAVADRWISLPLPETGKPPAYRVRFETTGKAEPRAWLRARGDALRLATTADGLDWAGNSGPARLRTPTNHYRFELPPFESEAVQVALEFSAALPSNVGPEVEVDGVKAQLLPDATGRRWFGPAARATAGLSPSLLDVRVGSGAPPPPFGVVVQPVFRTLACRPQQSGTYIFSVFEGDGRPARAAARQFTAGAEAKIHPPRRWAGGCLRFVLEGDTAASDLTHDAVFSFEGFHDREVSRIPGTPPRMWSAVSNAVVRVAVPRDRACEVSLTLRSAGTQPDYPSQARVNVSGRELPAAFEHGVWNVLCEAPPRLEATEDVLTIRLEAATWRPAEAWGSRDQRTLGVMLERLEVRY
jgi:hypothetical protein